MQQLVVKLVVVLKMTRNFNKTTLMDIFLGDVEMSYIILCLHSLIHAIAMRR